MMTTTPLTVAFDMGALDAGVAEGFARRSATYAAHRTALAALPGSFRVVAGQPSDVLVTIAAGTGWLDRTGPLLGTTAKAVLIAGLEPSAIDGLCGLATLAADRRLLVAVASGYADHATWQAALPDARRDLDELTFIDSVAAVPAGGSLFGALLDQMALAESLAGPLKQATVLTARASHYVLSADAGGTAVSLSGTACAAGPGSVELDLVGPRARWRVEFTAAGPARPAEITRHDASGGHARRPLFQGPQRACWLRMRDDLAGDAIASQAAGAGPLASLIARSELAAQVVTTS